jgi:hypothetical protein
MPDRLGRSQPDADTDVITRAAAVPALAALAVIHVVDLPGMPGPDRLAGFRYLGIIAVAVVAGAAMAAGPHRLARAAASELAAAMAGYVLPRACPAASSATTAMSATGAARWASLRSAHSSRPPVPASGDPETTTSRISR